MRPQKKKAQTFFSRSPGETKRLGAWLARKLRQGDLVCFCGELGSGKTTMIQGLVRSLTGQRAASPSFVILHEYDRGKLPVYHFDFYRLGKPDDLETIGWQEYLFRGIVLVEWADRYPELLREARFIVTFSGEDRCVRKISLVEFERLSRIR